jgi:hypothetical protein
LPLNKLEFNAQKINGKAVRNWSLKNEQYTTKYKIQKSTNGSSFTDIGEVNSSNQTSYSFTDNNFTQSSYYRILAERSNGALVSQVQYLLLLAGNAQVAVYPNPATSNTTTVQSINAIKSINATDAQGRQVLVQYPNATNVSLNLSNWKKGVYILTITTINKTVQQKLIVQ